MMKVAESEVEEAQRILEEVTERARRVKEFNLMDDLKNALENLSDVRSKIKTVESLKEQDDALTRAVNDLTIQVKAELTARRKQRDRENELLSQLSKYLDNWA